MFTERPLDALAYHELRTGEQQCVVSIGRELTPDLHAALKQAVQTLPGDKTVVTAFAHDLKGAALTRAIDTMAAGRQVLHDRPTRGRTWSDTIVATKRDLIRALGLTPGIDRGRSR